MAVRLRRRGKRGPVEVPVVVALPGIGVDRGENRPIILTGGRVPVGNVRLEPAR